MTGQTPPTFPSSPASAGLLTLSAGIKTIGVVTIARIGSNTSAPLVDLAAALSVSADQTSRSFWRRARLDRFAGEDAACMIR
jgi:hypothetical protein